MAIIASSSFTSFSGQRLVIDAPSLHSSCSSSSSVSYRPMKISAATCASTVNRPRVRTGTTNAPSLYEVLGVQAGATCQEIKTAYRRMARVVHPDVSSANGQSSSADEFMKVHEAYATLSDAQKRTDYDRLMEFRRPQTTVVGSPFTMSSSGGRRWETDQCW